MKVIYTITKGEVISLIDIIKALEHGIDVFSSENTKRGIYSVINNLNENERVLFKQISDLIKHDNLKVELDV